MSVYASATDLDRFGLRASALPGITSDDKLAAIGAASARADSYLAARFALPLTSWGDDLRQVVCTIAAFELIAGQVGFNPEAGGNIVLVDRKDDAIRWLEQVSRNHVTPSGITDSSVSSRTDAFSASNTPRGW
jgi:phage gp36-like protein